MTASLEDCIFAAGAIDRALRFGMSAGEASDLAARLCKEAAPRRRMWGDDDDDDDDEEEGTFWERNKGWLIPALIGGGAYWAVSDTARNKNPGMGMLDGAGDLWGRRLKALLGVVDWSKHDLPFMKDYGAK